MFWCQLILVLLQVFGFFSMIKRDIEGRPAMLPSGFTGVIGTIAVTALLVVLYFYCGSYSQLIH